MKPHLRLRFMPQVSLLGRFPYWQDVASHNAIAPGSIHPQIDALLSRYHLPVKVTQEYCPCHGQWTRQERASGLHRIYRLILKQNVAIPPLLIQQLSHSPLVEAVSIGEIGQAELPPILPAQLSVNTDERSREAIHLPEAHRYSQGDPNITVAVLDTGIDLDHPELEDALLPGYDFVNIVNGASRFVGDSLGYDEDPEDEVGHGTHVAGIIAAQGLAMPLGVVPHCKLLPVRVLGAMKKGAKRVGAGLVDNINSGIKWAIDQGADVINMSLGIRRTGEHIPHQEVVDYAQRLGVTLIAASGNDGKQESYYPGTLPYAIAVGALDEQGQIARFSTYGPQVDFVAPGTQIYSTYLQNDYGFSTGTSHAAPFVAGAVALLKSYALQKTGRSLSDRQVKYLLKHTSDKLDRRFKHPKAGFGSLNLLDALRLLDSRFAA